MHAAHRWLRPGALLLLLLAVASCAAGASRRSAPLTAAAAEPTELRGAWVQARALTSRASVDEILARAEEAGLNAVFVGVFTEGQTLFTTELAPTWERVEPGFNPLAYLVPEAHRRGLAVHAWFAAGLVGAEGQSPILAARPEWALLGPDGKRADWLNFARPDVREFMGDLMLEAVERYGVDGIHFDYTRYPGPEWGFDPYTSELARGRGLDLKELRYADLPAYGTFDGNPLTDPDGAELLASFANGLPAVTLNRYGEGQVLLLNWNAGRRTVAAGAEIIDRGIRGLRDEGGAVFVLRSAATIDEYGEGALAQTMGWLNAMGWAPQEADEAAIPGLDPGSVLVLPNVYLIDRKTAGRLADFAEGGGGLIFIDGPTPSMGLRQLRELTGMGSRGRYFRRTMLLLAEGEHPFILRSARGTDLTAYQELDERWKALRRAGVSQLIESVYRRVKARSPEVVVSATITVDQRKAADEVLQDWRAWLDGGYLDLLIPRGYVDKATLLTPALADWAPLIKEDERITVGLKVFGADGKAAYPKSPRQLLGEIQIARDAGSRGVMLFDLDRLTDDQLRALTAGPFAPPLARD